MRTVQVDLQWVLTTAVALYGAGLSTYNVYVARKQSKRQINVKISYGCLTFGPTLGEDMIMITAANVGHRPITLDSVGLRLPNGRSLINIQQEGSVPLPHPLKEGTSVTHWMPVTGVKESIRRGGTSGKVKLLAFYNDAVGVTHKSKPFSLEV
ncbi:MAG: hypothetical protein ACRD3P_06910 [Terriglobales bacterium]